MRNGYRWWPRLIMTLAATRPASWALSRWLANLDRIVLDLTQNRRCATRILTGLPVLTITTLGARTGRMHRTPLVYLMEGKNYILIATAFGGRKNPGWYYNVLAHPEIEVTIDGKTARYLGIEIVGSDRQMYWAKAVAHFPGYLKYQRRAAGRKIPILMLSPLA